MALTGCFGDKGRCDLLSVGSLRALGQAARTRPSCVRQLHILVLLIGIPAWAQNVNMERPQEVRSAQSADGKKPRVNREQLQKEARELADTSASIPADVDRANQGLLPKDLAGKLRRIEILSKRLRTELTRY